MSGHLIADLADQKHVDSLQTRVRANQKHLDSLKTRGRADQNHVRPPDMAENKQVNSMQTRGELIRITPGP